MQTGVQLGQFFQPLGIVVETPTDTDALQHFTIAFVGREEKGTLPFLAHQQNPWVKSGSGRKSARGKECSIPKGFGRLTGVVC